MKLSILIPFVAFIAQVTAAGLAATSENQDVEGITFIGQIKVGGPNVTLTGTAKDIYEQVLKLNPAYDPMDFEEFRGHQTSASIAARSGRVEKRDWIDCHPWSANDAVPNPSANCPNSVRYLRNLNGWCGTGAKSCARTVCSDSCGIWLCNDNNYGISTWCANLAGDTMDVLEACTERVGTIVTRVRGIQYRTGDGGWSTHVRRC